MTSFGIKSSMIQNKSMTVFASNDLSCFTSSSYMDHLTRAASLPPSTPGSPLANTSQLLLDWNAFVRSC